MAYDEALADRVRALCGLPEKRMFGGLALLLGGHLAVCVIGEGLLVRVAPDEYAEALAAPGAGVFDLTGRVMSGWVLVSADVLESDDDLAGWVERGTAYAGSLPPK